MIPDARFDNPIPNSFRHQKFNFVTLDRVCKAAYHGDFEHLETMLSTGDADTIFNGDLNMHFTDVTPLHMAAIAGHEDCVKLMLEAKADPWVKTRTQQGTDPSAGETARDKAARFKHAPVVALLEQAEKDSPPGWYAPDGIGNNRKLYAPPDEPPAGAKKPSSSSAGRLPAETNSHKKQPPGVLKKGDGMDIRPGVVSKDDQGNSKSKPIGSQITSSAAEQDKLQAALPGGPLVNGAKADPALRRGDCRLVGKIASNPAIDIEVKYYLLRCLLQGGKTESGSKQGEAEPAADGLATLEAKPAAKPSATR